MKKLIIPVAIGILVLTQIKITVETRDKNINSLAQLPIKISVWDIIAGQFQPAGKKPFIKIGVSL